MSAASNALSRAVMQAAEHPVSRRAARQVTLSGLRGVMALLTWIAAITVSATLHEMAVEAVAGENQWTVAVVFPAIGGLFVALSVGASLMASWRSSWPGRRRVTLARLRRAAAEFGVRVPTDRQWYRPRLLVSVALAIGAASVMLRPEVLRFIVRFAAGPATDSQQADSATRIAWRTAGFPGEIPGSALVSGVVTEEVFFRGCLLLVVAASYAIHIENLRWRVWFRGVTVGIAWLISTLVFGLMHANFSELNVVLGWVLGGMFGALTIWTRSLVPAVAGHLTWNLIASGVI